MSTTASMAQRLREHTRTAHTHVESLPFWEALQAGTLPRGVYVLYLEAMLLIHEALEDAAMSGHDPVLTACWDRAHPRAQLLRDDLAHFQSERPAQLSKPLLHAIMLAEEIVLRERRDPASLVGYLYVLEGSALGGLVLRPQVVHAFGLEGADGTAYFSGHAQKTRGLWTTFTRAVDSALAEAPLQQRVLDAALEAFEGIGRMVESLHPRNTDTPEALGRALNPGFGNHPMTNDPREIRAALRAGVRTWERFPYYESRYGRRGRSFTRSDSAWLVTLARQPQPVVDQQIRWLGQVLAARGMPRWLLEQHLEVLHEELVTGIPEDGDTYGPLLLAAQHLRRQRTSVFDEQQWHDLATGFDDAVGAHWARQFPGCGALLVAAVADEVNGVQNPIMSLGGWLADPTRFPSEWAAAVRQTVAHAREQAGGGRGNSPLD